MVLFSSFLSFVTSFLSLISIYSSSTLTRDVTYPQKTRALLICVESNDLWIICWFKKIKTNKGSTLCEQFMLFALVRLRFFVYLFFDCLGFLTWLQRDDLEDPCVFHTQLTKQLNLIALMGIVLFRANLICMVFFLFFFVTKCEIEFSLLHMWYARLVSP